MGATVPVATRARRIAVAFVVAILVFGLAAPDASVARGWSMTADGAKTAIERVSPRTPAEAIAAERGVNRLASPALPLRVAPRGQGQPDAGNGAPAEMALRAPTPLVYDGPPPKNTVAFPGVRLADGCDCEPPDPWLAASGSHVVQATNSFVRIFDRSGNEKLSVPMGAFFGIPPWELSADPRLLWDAAHARWVGVALSFSPDFEDTFLNVVVSETSDPLGAWRLVAFYYGNSLPDYPGIASSSDKIVLTANEFPGGGGFSHASLLVVGWNAILEGGAISAGYIERPPWFTPRPAQVLSSATDVHVIAERWSDGAVIYARVKGVGTSARLANVADLTASLAVAPFAPPAAPRQPGTPATIEDAIDQRPTDAVWRQGRLWFVSSRPHSWDGGGTTDVAVRLTQLVTTSGAPTLKSDVVIGRLGFDAYMGGIGISGNRTLFATYTESSPTQFASSRVAVHVIGDGFSDSILLEAGEHTYDGTRWGDYVGVAADPKGTGAAWVATEEPDSDGAWRTTVRRIVVDGDKPAATAPKQTIVTPSTLDATIPVRLTWSGNDPTSGVDRYRFSENLAGAGWLTPPMSTAATRTVRHAWVGTTNRYRARAVDGYGNVGAWKAGPTFTPLVRQQGQANFTGSWSTGSNASFSGGSTKYATNAGAHAVFTFTGRSVALVSFVGPNRGTAKVYVDGALKGKINTHSGTSKARRIVWQRTWGSVGSHTIKLVVSGTAGHPRFDVDAFVVLQ